jgi:L-fuculose-phosphate aldolase
MNARMEERRLVVETCLELSRLGYIPGTGGNAALRVSAEEFAVTPTASDYEAMTPDDVAVLRLDTLEQVAGTKAPSVEAGLHAEFLRFRTDFAASIHTHQPIASAASLLGVDLPIEDPEHRRTLGPAAPIAPYAPSGTRWLARAFARTLRRDCAAYLLQNHGVVCGGASMEEALANAQTVERAAAAVLSGLVRRADGAGRGLSKSLRRRVLRALE